MTSLYPLRSSLVSTSWLNSIKPQYTAQMYTKHEKDNLKLKIVASSDPKPKQNIVDTRFLPSAAVVLASLAFVDAGWSGDWSRIEVLTIEQENFLKSASIFVVPLMGWLTVKLLPKDK